MAAGHLAERCLTCLESRFCGSVSTCLPVGSATAVGRGYLEISDQDFHADFLFDHPGLQRFPWEWMLWRIVARARRPGHLAARPQDGEYSNKAEVDSGCLFLPSQFIVQMSP